MGLPVSLLSAIFEKRSEESVKMAVIWNMTNDEQQNIDARMEGIAAR